jgi:PKD repeat protein
MDPLPTDPFGAADGVLHAAGGDQFWYVGGAINNFATVTDEARYWDDADGAWHLAGTTGKAAYRVEGDFLDGEFYFVNGSSGGFTPTNTGKKGTFDGTNWVWTDLPLTNNLRMDNIVNAFEGTVWSVDGYGTSNSGYVEKLASCPLCEGVVVDIPPLDVELCQDATEVIVGTLTNTGAVDVTFSVTETLDFLGVEPITGTILPGGSTVLTFTFDTTGLAPGLYTGDVTIMTDDPVTGDIVLPVSLLVNQNTEILDVAYDVNFLDVSFEAMITGTEPLETFWDFGDGITQTGGLTATHTYAAGGCYNVMFEVSGPCGVETLEFEVCVCEPFGGADFTWMPDPAIAGEDTLFEATVISGTAPFEFTWDFGDGITPTVGGITTTHAFAAAGDYTVTLTVADACESIIVEHLVTVLPPPCEPPAGVDFMWTPEEPLTGEAVVFEGTVMTGTEPFTFDWLITDAFTPTPDITGTGQTFTYTFDAAGVYTVTLTVTNECGTETATATITVMAPVFKAYLPVILRATVP